MDSEYLIQCKKVMMNNKKSKKYIKLTLADKIYLILLSRRIKKEGCIDNITFEEFVLLCKHNKINAILKIESPYSTSFIDILQLDIYTLHTAIMKALYETELYQRENNEELKNMMNEVRSNNIILFEYFISLCDKLNIKVFIE